MVGRGSKKADSGAAELKRRSVVAWRKLARSVDEDRDGSPERLAPFDNAVRRLAAGLARQPDGSAVAVAAAPYLEAAQSAIRATRALHAAGSAADAQAEGAAGQAEF